MGYITKKSKSFTVPPKMYSCAGQGAQFIKLPLYTKHRANVDSCFAFQVPLIFRNNISFDP